MQMSAPPPAPLPPPQMQPSPSPTNSSPPHPLPDWARVHLIHIQWVRDLLVIAMIVGIIYLGYLLKVVTIPILLALLLAYLFEPLIRCVTRSGHISRQFAAAGIIVAAAVLIVAPVIVGVGFAAVQTAQYASGIAAEIGRLRASVDDPYNPEKEAAVPEGGWRRIRDAIVNLETPDYEPPEAIAWSPPEGTYGVAAEVLTLPRREPDELAGLVRFVANWVEANAAEIGRRAVGTGATAVGAAVSTIANIGLLAFTGLLTAFFFFYFSTGWGRVLAFWEGLVPERKKGRVLDLVKKMDRVIAGFVRGRLIIVGILMVYATLAFWLIGVPVPLVVGPIYGLLFLVPYLAAVGVPVAMLLMWLEPVSTGWQTEWWWVVLGPIAVHAGAQVLDDWILSPIIQGKNTDMDTPTILFASLAGGALAGVYGLLLAIPVAACLKILIKEVLWPRVDAYLQGKATDILPIEGRRGSG